MAFIDKIVKFHTFSKSTVRDNLTLGEAVNPSGHTVVSSQVRTDDIPAFIDTFQDTKDAALTWAATNVDANARHNDILYYGGKFNMGFSNPKCLIRVAKQVVDGKLVDLPADQHSWQDFTIVGKSFLANADGKNVIAIHTDADICYVHGDNNAAVNSNQNSAFVRKADGSFLDHFVAPTDQILGGQPSLGYGLCLFKSGTTKALTEGEETGKNNYIGNTFAGLIHFMDTRSETADATDNYKAAGFSVNCFEYIGDKLDTTIGNIREEIQDIVGVTIEGVVASVTANEAAQSAGINVDSTAKTSPKITFTAGSVATGETKLVSGGAVKTYVDTTALAEGGSIAKAIATAKAEAIANAKVTLTAGNGITIPNSGSQDTAFTISVDTDVIATKKSVDDLSGIVTALGETVGSNKTEVDGKISAIEGKLASTGEIGQAIADVKATADAAVQSVTRASGSSTLLTVTDGTNATISLSTEVATKSDAATAASTAITTSLNGTTAGTIGAAVADAKKAGTDAQTAADAKVANITVDGTSIVTGNAGSKTAALTTTKAVAITPSADSASTALATEASVAKALASITSVGVSYQVLTDGQTHTSITAPVKGRIYLEKDTTNAEAGVYIEWMYTEKGWEQIGSTKTDHSSYASKITVNGSEKSVANSAVDLGAFASTVASGQATTLANQGSVYANIATNGTLTLGVASATDSVMGVSKMFTGDLSTTASTVTDTAVSVKSAQAMYSSLATLTNSKISSVSDDWYLNLAGLAVSTSGTDVKIKATSITNFDSSIIGVNGNIATGQNGAKVNIDTDKIFATNSSETPITMIKGKTNLQYWIADISNVVNGYEMFAECSQLTTFCGDLSSLTNGGYMFSACNALTSFCGDLSSLTNGGMMFGGCKLDAESLECIAETLPTATGGKQIDICYNCPAADAAAAKDAIQKKGWNCTMTYMA